MYVNFNPSKGHEQKFHRPALVISHDKVRDMSGISIVVPISNTKREYPLYHELKTTKKITGKALLDQSRALDLKSRGLTQSKVVERVSKRELKELIETYKLIFTVD
ncbi:MULTISPECIES: type II toxin-antitoxin system PemK/MazF family toxin [Nosocomiicoccus]|uniref:type II toxin-antitoxin system PemK/MazF family toxin n=1 Tax=Nosocomiicoccus TaxID=489909 RepID=UPI000AA40C56|nr:MULTISPECIES: type II toxin-antitoxin system PemK/MazF family toxin [Nosocomiicoccus]